MTKICPFMTANTVDKVTQCVCLEENCALWLPKGQYKKDTIKEGLMKGATIYEAEGTCAIVVICKRL